MGMMGMSITYLAVSLPGRLVFISTTAYMVLLDF
jgi:hypothetical protein